MVGGCSSTAEAQATTSLGINKISDYTSGGIVLAYPTSTDNRIYGNRIFNGRVGNGGAITNVTGSNHLIYNNTFYNTSIGVGDGSASGVIIRNNIFNAVATPVGTGSYTTSNNICDSVVTGCASSATAAQLFANVTDLTFVLKTTVTRSPAIDAGNPNIAPGVTIPACSGGITAGCYNDLAPGHRGNGIRRSYCWRRASNAHAESDKCSRGPSY